jgi:hypothetical protein
MTHYYYGPRRGITSFRGQPYLYESRFSDIDSESDDTFLLSPVSPFVFKLALESWAIWLRWETAFREGRTSQETHPALPEDSARCAALDLELASRLMLDESKAICALGDFRTRPGSSIELGASPDLEVEWTPLLQRGVCRQSGHL